MQLRNTLHFPGQYTYQTFILIRANHFILFEQKGGGGLGQQVFHPFRPLKPFKITLEEVLEVLLEILEVFLVVPWVLLDLLSLFQGLLPPSRQNQIPEKSKKQKNHPIFQSYSSGTQKIGSGLKFCVGLCFCQVCRSVQPQECRKRAFHRIYFHRGRGN